MRKLWFVILIFFGVQARCFVDVENGNFSEQFIDVKISGNSARMPILRAYNSKAKYSGLFGQGWCSNIETKLDFQAEEKLKILECGAGAKHLFQPTNRQKRQFSTNLLDPLDLITRRGAQYVRTLNGKPYQVFDQQGRLESLYFQGERFDLKYRGAKLALIKSEAEVWMISINPTLTITEIKSKRGILKYQYRDGALTMFKNLKGQVYSFEYNAKAQMTKITYPDKKMTQITYAVEHSRVISVVEPDGCTSEAEYHFTKDINNYSVAVKTKCNGQTSSRVVYEIRREKGPDGQYHLAYLKLFNGDKILEKIYDSKFGRLIEVKGGMNPRKMDLDTKGLVTAIRRPTSTTNIKYDSLNRPIHADSSQGISLSIGYDGNGQISEMKDQNNQLIRIQYHPIRRTVSKMTMKGVGSIDYVYKSSGAVLKIDNHGPPGSTSFIYDTYQRWMKLLTQVSEVQRNG